MLASTPEFREVDFSHLTIFDSDIDPGSAGSVRKQQSLLLWCALLLSLLLHLSLLFFQFGEQLFSPKQVPTQTLHIDLRQLPSKKQDVEPEIITRELIETSIVQKVEQEVVAPPPMTAKMVTVEDPGQAKPTQIVIEPTSMQELAEIINKHNAQTNDQGSAAISENVFHPGLRARLSEEANKPILARIEDAGPKTYADPSGATIVVLGSGDCLMSPLNTKIGAPKNWYMTPCVGKTESEKIMDRVNESVNGKLKFGE